nr:hypothetical protein CFP56_66516 [Quercus suber]
MFQMSIGRTKLDVSKDEVVNGADIGLLRQSVIPASHVSMIYAASMTNRNTMYSIFLTCRIIISTIEAECSGPLLHKARLVNGKMTEFEEVMLISWRKRESQAGLSLAGKRSAPLPRKVLEDAALCASFRRLTYRSCPEQK